MSQSHKHKHAAINFFLSGLVALTATIVFYRTCIDEDREQALFDINVLLNNWLFALLAVGSGINDFFDFSDHFDASHHHHDHHDHDSDYIELVNSTYQPPSLPTSFFSEEDPKRQPLLERPIQTEPSLLEKPKKSLQEHLVKGSLIIAAIPLGLASCYSLFQQSCALVQSIYGKNLPTAAEVSLSFYPLSILLLRFYYISVQHALSNIMGTHEEFTARAIKCERSKNFLDSPWKRFGVLGLMTLTHCLESFLLADEVDNYFFRMFCVVSLSLFRSCGHLDHVAEAKNALGLYKDYDWRGKTILALTGSVMGIIHACPSALATAYLWKKSSGIGGIFANAAMVAVTASELMVGALEANQHLGRKILDSWPSMRLNPI